MGDLRVIAQEARRALNQIDMLEDKLAPTHHLYRSFSRRIVEMIEDHLLDEDEKVVGMSGDIRKVQDM